MRLSLKHNALFKLFRKWLQTLPGLDVLIPNGVVYVLCVFILFVLLATMGVGSFGYLTVCPSGARECQRKLQPV